MTIRAMPDHRQRHQRELSQREGTVRRGAHRRLEPGRICGGVDEDKRGRGLACHARGRRTGALNQPRRVGLSATRPWAACRTDRSRRPESRAPATRLVLGPIRSGQIACRSTEGPGARAGSAAAPCISRSPRLGRPFQPARRRSAPRGPALRLLVKTVGDGSGALRASVRRRPAPPAVPRQAPWDRRWFPTPLQSPRRRCPAGRPPARPPGRHRPPWPAMCSRPRRGGRTRGPAAAAARVEVGHAAADHPVAHAFDLAQQREVEQSRAAQTGDRPLRPARRGRASP